MVRKTKEEAEQTRKEIIIAARNVFHECGVGRSSLDKIAKTAGVTRGAVYWHFADKAELFFAMREDVFAPMLERTDARLYDTAYDNPLDAIEASISEFFRVLDECVSSWYASHRFDEALAKAGQVPTRWAENLLAGIAASKAPKLARLLFALGIRHVGETTAKTLLVVRVLSRRCRAQAPDQCIRRDFPVSA